MTDATPPRGQGELLEATIEETGRRLKFGTLLYRLLCLTTALILFPLLVVVGDHAVSGGLPRPVVFGAGILWGLVAVLATAGMSLRTMWRRLNKLFVARYVERSRGIPHNSVMNLVLLQRSSGAGYARDAAVQQAESVLATSGPEAPDSRRTLRSPGLFLLTAVGVWLLYAAISPKPILPSLARLFGGDRDAPTATRLELLRPRSDEPVYVGEPLEILFAVSGRPAAAVEFELLDPGRPETPPLLRYRLTRGGESETGDGYRVVLAAHEVSADLHYRCSAGDAVAEGVIPVVSRGDLLDFWIELVPPAYTGKRPGRTADPELRVWAGTQATFVAHANTDLTDPIFVLRGESETRTRMSVVPAQPRRATLSLPLTTSGEYWIEFSDRWGRPCSDPPRHRIVVRQDRAPRVEITTPTREETPADVVDVTHTAWLKVRASDDVQLTALLLVRDTDGTIDRAELLDSEAIGRDQSFETGVATSDLPLEVGESLRVWFEARDNRVLLDGTSTPQVATSRELTLIRTPDLVSEETGEDYDDSELTGAVGSSERVVKRYRPGEEDGGGDDQTRDDGDGLEDSEDGWGGPDSPETKYRRAPDGDTGGEAGDDESPPAIDPEDAVEDGAEDSPRESGDEIGDADEQSESEGRFEEELRRFDREHGDEARELSGEREGEADSDDSDSSQAGQGAESGGGQNELPEEGSQSDERSDPNSDQSGGAQPNDSSEEETAAPESQPSEPDQEEHDQLDQGEARDRESDEMQPPQEDAETEEPGDNSEDAEHEPESRQPEGQPTSPEQQSEEGGQCEGGSEGQTDEAESKQTDSEGDAEEIEAGGQQPAPTEQSADDAEAASETDAAGDQQAGGGEPERRSESGTQPDVERRAGGQVIPLSGEGPPPRIAPLPEPDEPGQAATVEPVPDSEARSELTDTLELLRRGAAITAEDLADLDWPPARKLAFVRDFERLREAARRAGVLSPVKWWQTRMELGSGEVSSGVGLSGEVSVGVAGGPVLRDGLEQIAPPAEQRVAPELQALLDAYYRSLAEKQSQERDTEAP